MSRLYHYYLKEGTGISLYGNYNTTGRSQVVDEKFVSNFFKKNKQCLKGTPIYRGLEFEENYLYVEPSKYERVSANARNYYTLLIDNLPAWKKYPKRSKSIICTTNPLYAGDFGKLFLVYFEDNAKIGVCSYEDIWGSFLPFENLVDFNYTLSEIFESFSELMYTDPKTFRQLSENLKNLDIFKRKNKNDNDEEIIRQHYANKWEKILQNKYDIFMQNYIKSPLSFIDYLNEELSPSKNGFKLLKTGSEIQRKKEVWSDGNALMIDANIASSLSNESRIQFRDFSFVHA